MIEEYMNFKSNITPIASIVLHYILIAFCAICLLFAIIVNNDYEYYRLIFIITPLVYVIGRLLLERATIVFKIYDKMR